MSKDKVAGIVERLQKVTYQSSFSGESRFARFAIRYYQGNRTFYVTAFSAVEIEAMTKIDTFDEKNGDINPEIRWNRPRDRRHVEAIENYLTNSESKKDYIIPPITLDAEKQLEFIDCGESEGGKMTIGCLFIPLNYRFHVTDGQHRIIAITKAREENKDLEKHAFAVNIVQETHIDKVHQDFADCAKVKPISQSLLTTFETREAIKLFSKEVCKRVALFKRRVEKVSISVGKTSSKLYTINHVKIACEQLLLGDKAGSNRIKSVLCAEELEGRKHQVWLERVVKFFELFSQTNAQWKQVLGLDISGGQATSTLKKLKAEYILFNATALVIIGRVGHEILKNPQLIEHKTKELANLDWSRTTNGKPNSFWEGTILLGNTVVNTREATSKASAKVKNHLNLSLTEHEKKLILDSQPPEPELVEAM